MTNKSSEELSRLLTVLYLIFASVRTPSVRVAVNSSISSSAVSRQRLMRTVVSASRSDSPKARRARLMFLECVEQAEPLEMQIPRDERKFSAVSLFMPGSVMLNMCGADAGGRFGRMLRSACRRLSIARSRSELIRSASSHAVFEARSTAAEKPRIAGTLTVPERSPDS